MSKILSLDIEIIWKEMGVNNLNTIILFLPGKSRLKLWKETEVGIVHKNVHCTVHTYTRRKMYIYCYEILKDTLSFISVSAARPKSYTLKKKHYYISCFLRKVLFWNTFSLRSLVILRCIEPYTIKSLTKVRNFCLKIRGGGGTFVGELPIKRILTVWQNLQKVYWLYKLIYAYWNHICASK